MTDLLTLIDEFEPLIKESFLSAVDDARAEILKRIEQANAENYPTDTTQLPQENGSDIFGLESLESLLSKDFEQNLSALHDNTVILLLSVLEIRELPFPDQFKTELIKSEIREISLNTVKAVQSVGANTKRIFETIGLTTNQAKSLLTFRQALENITQSEKQVYTSRLSISSKVRKESVVDFNIISPAITRNLSASQRSILRKAINTGLDPKRIDKLVAKQYKALLTHRAKAIGRNIACKVAHATQQSVVSFATKTGLINPNNYRRYWVTTHDEKVRFSHNKTEAMNSKGVSIDKPFQTPFGPVMNPPLEINCRCHVAIRKVKK